MNHPLVKMALFLALYLAVPYISSGQMEAYSPYENAAIYEPGTSSAYGQEDDGFTAASGYHEQRNIEIYQTSQTEFEAFIPNMFVETGQVGSDGTFSSYPNVGSSGVADIQSFLVFDISSIPKEATIQSATLEFAGCDMVGSPFSSLGCLKIYALPYRQIGSRSYSSLAAYPSCGEICSFSQLNTPLGSPILAMALQSALEAEKLQLGLQFEREGTVQVSETSPTSISYNYPSSRSTTSQYNGYGSYDGSDNYQSDPLSVRQAMEDMGVDITFLQSELGGKADGSNPRYIILNPDVNLTELGITQEMLENAIDPGKIRTAIVEEGAPCTYAGESGVWHSSGGFWYCDTSGSASPEVASPWVVDLVTAIDPLEGATLTPYVSTPSCPRIRDYSGIDVTYCDDCNDNGICDYREPVISGETVVSRPVGSQATVVAPSATTFKPIEPGTATGQAAPSSPSRPSIPTVEPQRRAAPNLIRIGVVRLVTTYSLPKIVEPQPPTPYPRERNRRVRLDLGICRFQPPDPGRLIDATSFGWGEVPSNQVLVQVDLSLDFQEARIVARQLAASLGGQVVGELEYTNLFQIETQSQSAEELKRDISNAEGYPLVSLAFPNQQVFREAPLDDSIYRGKNGKGFQMIGVADAWRSIRSIRDSGIELSEVYVGVTDDGLYKGYHEFDKTDINTSMDLYDESPSLLTKPLPGLETAGSHGTGIMNILAADADDGGLVGIASEPLKEKLKVDMISILSGDRFYITTSLMGLKTEIENGCNILSCSWGNSDADPRAAEMYENWFKKLWNDFPDIIFICSAGNEGGAMETNRRIPNGLPNCPDSLPNVLTVGNILNDGEMCPESNRNYHNNYVSLAAPGEEAVWGMNDSGQIYNSSGGTSMAVPHVTATVALIRSINPGLNAGEIKELLTETGRSSLDGVDAPEDLGGKVLAIDIATERAIRERPPEVQAPQYPFKVIEIPIYKGDILQGRVDTGRGANYQESGIFDASITIRSAQYRGYEVSVDDNYLGTEGTGNDPLDGIFTFDVAGNQQHLIIVEHPLNWKRWQYFYDAGKSYSYEF